MKEITSSFFKSLSSASLIFPCIFYKASSVLDNPGTKSTTWSKGKRASY